MTETIEAIKPEKVTFVTGAVALTIPIATDRLPEGQTAHITISFGRKEQHGTTLAEPRISFFVKDENNAAEWHPPYGPIMIWHRSDEADATNRAGHIFTKTANRPMDWSQSAVDECGLPDSAIRGEWDWIFSELSRWVRA